MILQASSGHEFINKKPLIIFNTVANKFDQILMNKVTQIIHLSLQYKQHMQI